MMYWPGPGYVRAPERGTEGRPHWAMPGSPSRVVLEHHVDQGAGDEHEDGGKQDREPQGGERDHGRIPVGAGSRLRRGTRRGKAG